MKDYEKSRQKIIVESQKTFHGYRYRWECRICFHKLPEYSLVQWYGVRFPLKQKSPNGYAWSSPWEICMEDAALHIAWHREWGSRFGV